MRHLSAVVLGLLATLVLFSADVRAVQPDEMLPDPALEARARTIGKDLRCLVCQNQSIDDSDADLAKDLRGLVRQRLTAGDSDAQAKQYIVDRYGDYVLLNPPFKGETLVLWLGPLVFLIGAILVAVAFFRGRSANASTSAVASSALDEAEKHRIAAMLEESNQAARGQTKGDKS